MKRGYLLSEFVLWLSEKYNVDPPWKDTKYEILFDNVSLKGDKTTEKLPVTTKDVVKTIAPKLPDLLKTKMMTQYTRQQVKRRRRRRRRRLEVAERNKIKRNKVKRNKVKRNKVKRNKVKNKLKRNIRKSREVKKLRVKRSIHEKNIK